MALPKSVSTERSQHLQRVLRQASEEGLKAWPMPAQADFALLGAYIVLYSYIDLNLRRILEVLDKDNKLPEPWKGKSAVIRDADLVKAALSVADWSESNIAALRQIDEHRGMRNLLAHFTMRKFPDDNAYVFITKSIHDYRRAFGSDPEPGMALTAVVDSDGLRAAMKTVERLQVWVSKIAVQVETQFYD
jgi:hypothetical protein